MKSIIVWVHILLNTFKKLDPEKLIVYCGNLKNQLTIDPDIPVAGSPITMAVYGSQINDLSAVLISRKSSSSKSLTIDDHTKVSTLINSTITIAHYVEFKANNLFPGNVEIITKIFNRLGFEARGHGVGKKHSFKITETGVGFAILQLEIAGDGAIYYLRWSADQKTWTRIRGTHESTLTVDELPSGKVSFESAVMLPVGKGKHLTVHANDDQLEWSDPITVTISFAINNLPS